MSDLTREQAFVDAMVSTMRSAPLARRMSNEKLESLACLIGMDVQVAHKQAGASPEDASTCVELRHGLQLAARAACYHLGWLTITEVEPIPRGAHGQDIQMNAWFGLDFPALLAQVADLDDLGEADAEDQEDAEGEAG